MSKAESPDYAADGLLRKAVSARRYGVNERALDPYEVTGIIHGLIPSNCSVLDVGCAAGSATLSINRGKGNTVLGVEPDPVRAGLARDNGLNVINGYLDQALIDAHGPFDVVMFTDVLEHIASPSEVLNLGIAALKPGGLLVASVPNVAHWTVRLRLLFGRWEYTSKGIMDATHLRWFTHKSFKAFFKAHKLRIESVKSTSGTWMYEYKRLRLGRPGNRLIHWATGVFPTLFGCQIIIAARTPDRHDGQWPSN